MLIAAIAEYTAYTLFAAWWLISCLKKYGLLRFRWLEAFRAEIQPFVLPLILVRYFAWVYQDRADHPYINGNAVMGLILGVWLWWEFRHDDDDRWKRRRRKVLDRVRATASGRLVAVADEKG